MVVNTAFSYICHLFSWHSLYSQVSLNFSSLSKLFFLLVFQTPTTFILIYIAFYQLPSTLTPRFITCLHPFLSVALILAQMLSKHLR